MMSKPIGYYTTLSPGATGKLNEIENSFGSKFEKLSKEELLLFLFLSAERVAKQYAEQLVFNEGQTEVEKKIQQAVESFQSLSFTDSIGLIRAMADRLDDYAISLESEGQIDV